MAILGQFPMTRFLQPSNGSNRERKAGVLSEFS